MCIVDTLERAAPALASEYGEWRRRPLHKDS